MEINTGDIFDIGQTINGVSRFIWFGDKWNYFEDRITAEYEYSQEDLTKLILENCEDGTGEVVFLGNVFALFKQSQI